MTEEEKRAAVKTMVLSTLASRTLLEIHKHGFEAADIVWFIALLVSSSTDNGCASLTVGQTLQLIHTRATLLNQAYRDPQVPGPLVDRIRLDQELDDLPDEMRRRKA